MFHTLKMFIFWEREFAQQNKHLEHTQSYGQEQCTHQLAHSVPLFTQLLSQPLMKYKWEH